MAADPSLARRRGAVAWIALVGTVALAAAALPSQIGRGGRVAFAPEDDPWVRLDREITREFGMENPVLWLVEAERGTIWTRPVLERIVELTRAVLRIRGVRAVDVMSLASPNLRQVRMSASGIAPAYVMVSVPPTEEAIAELRTRVESDENLAGTLVARDGRAAIVVANFPGDEDADGIAAEALALRDRLSGPDAAIHVVGAPVLAAEARRAASALAAAAALAVIGAAVVAIAMLGASGLLAAAVAAVLALLWSAVALLVADAVVWPWSGLAVLPVLLLATTATAACAKSGDAVPRWWRVLAIAAVPAAGFAAVAIVSPPPVRAFGWAGAVGSVAAAIAGRVASPLAAVPRAAGWDTWLRGRSPPVAAAAVVIAAILAVPWVGSSFSLLGYGERYLPAGATEGLRSLRRLMAPPTSLAIRVRGEPGFLTDPEVLGAMDAVVQRARSDPHVARAQSLADLVKIVNRTFHDDDATYAVIPEEEGLAARYLALAYSPPFRRFVDRGLGRGAIWVDLASDRAADVAVALDALAAAMREHPVAGGVADGFGGDGAVLLVMARMARRLALATVALVAASVLTAAAAFGRGPAARTAVAAVASAAVSAGGLAWLGLPADLLTVSCIAGAAAAGAGAGAWTSVEGGALLVRVAGLSAGLGLAACAAPLAAANVVGLLLVGCGAAGLLAGAPSMRTARLASLARPRSSTTGHDEPRPASAGR